MDRMTDFGRVIVEIQASYGLDDVQLAEMMDVNRTTITRLRERVATNPSYDLGARLVRMHDEKPRQKRAKR